MKQHVEGYNVRTSYDGPYLDGADFDPDEVFANAGDPEAAQKVQEAKQPAPEPEEVSDESQGVTGDEKDATPGVFKVTEVN